MALGKRYEIYLPLEYNPDTKGNRQRIEQEKFEQTFEEISHEFGGVTLTPPTENRALRGIWRSESGQLFDDSVITALAYTTDINRADQFFRELRETCMERFQQEEILILSWIVERID
jgi:hypothetical protein